MNTDNLWIDKSGEEHDISTMGDFHLFTVMESLMKMARMKRRKEIEYLTALCEMYDEAGSQYLSQQSQEMLTKINGMFISINNMNTDAYGKDNIPHYEAIMLEAAARGMRESFDPNYDKVLDNEFY